MTYSSKAVTTVISWHFTAIWHHLTWHARPIHDCQLYRMCAVSKTNNIKIESYYVHNFNITIHRLLPRNLDLMLRQPDDPVKVTTIYPTVSTVQYEQLLGSSGVNNLLLLTLPASHDLDLVERSSCYYWTEVRLTRSPHWPWPLPSVPTQFRPLNLQQTSNQSCQRRTLHLFSTMQT